MRRSIPTVIALAWLGACGGEPAPPPPAAETGGPTRADSVAMAAAAFDSTGFDTIAWNSPDDALTRGGMVYRVSCTKCHGVTGAGDGDLVTDGASEAPPSFLAPDWQFREDPMGLRRAIFTGSTKSMPYWGLVGLKYRDLDAVSRYVTEYLRSVYATP